MEATKKDAAVLAGPCRVLNTIRIRSHHRPVRRFTDVRRNRNGDVNMILKVVQNSHHHDFIDTANLTKNAVKTVDRSRTERFSLAPGRSVIQEKMATAFDNITLMPDAR